MNPVHVKFWHDRGFKLREKVSVIMNPNAKYPCRHVVWGVASVSKVYGPVVKTCSNIIPVNDLMTIRKR
ncbi:MAG: hypothetical protein ACD_75C00540G0006 [uncultured bacterium]|nr:MAG: hypothetical protein ACD_75C00540G0006 [uncultured bacterium]